jgi:hypothetical protein
LTAQRGIDPRPELPNEQGDELAIALRKLRAAIDRLDGKDDRNDDNDRNNPDRGK